MNEILNSTKEKQIKKFKTALGDVVK